MSIELWAARLERPLTERETAAMLRLLPEARRERLLRIKQPEKRREPLCAYLILRHALWEQYRWRELPEIRLSSFGKPYFPDLPRFSFNLSHSGLRCLCLVSDDGQKLGCDLEQLRPLPQWEKLAGRFFHPLELEWLHRQQQPETAFFRLWCEKEAVIKATAAGFSRGMKWFSLRGETSKTLPPVRMAKTTEEYAYALCLEQGRRVVPIEEVNLAENCPI